MLSTILKEKTASSHTQLEQALFASAIMDGSFTPANYNIVLRVNYLVHYLLEPIFFIILSNKIQEEVGLLKRKKTGALAEDIQASGIDPTTDQSLDISVPDLENEGEALGALYVLEGATLGGQVIIRRLKKDPAFSSSPLAYYNVYAAETGTMWKQFLEAMNQYEDHNSVLIGAQKVYDLYLKTANSIKQAHGQ